MKKLMMLLVLGMFMVSFASAATIDNIRLYDSDQNKITVRNALNLPDWLGGSTIIEATLKENWCIDSRFCKAKKQVTLYEDMALIEDWKTLRVDDGSWDEEDIRSHSFRYYGTVEDYENRCTYEDAVYSNKTSYTKVECQEILIGKHKEWITFYEGQVFEGSEEGITYEVETLGEIKPGNVYDWQVKIGGKWTTPWSIWGNISAGDDSEVILNSPANNFQPNFVLSNDTLPFNASANVTGGASLVNMSWYSNSTGTWKLNETRIISDLFDWDNGTEAYYKLDNNDFSDATGNGNNAVNSGSTNISGILIDGRNLDGTDHINTTFLPNTTANFTWTTWVKGNTSSVGFIISSFGPALNNGVNLNMLANGTIRASSGGGGSTITLGATDTAIDDGDWHLVTFTQGGTTGTLYLDDDAPEVNGTWTPFASPSALIIGKQGTSGTNFNGDVDEIGIWNRSLSASEVSVLYNSGNALPFGQGSTTTSSTQIWNKTTNNTIIWNVEACDSEGDCGFALQNYTVLRPKIRILNQTFNLGTLETKQETFKIAVDANASLTSVNLVYNGDLTAATLSGGQYSASVFAPQGLANRTWFWNFVYGTETFNSTAQNQSVGLIELINCNSTNESSYLHIDFKDEEDSTSLNATVSSSTWDFWIDDSSNPKNFAFTNATENPTYDFCFTPSNETYTLDIEFPYASTNYPQRVFRTDDISFTNDTTNTTLYLLSSSDGFFTRYAAINSLTGAAVVNVSVTVQKDILTIPTTVSQGLTDDTGLITLWLNPDDLHTFTFTKSGFAVNNFQIRPSSPDTYQIAMVPLGAVTSVGNGTDVTNNLTYEILPIQISLSQDTTYTFSFNVSRTPAVDSMNMKLTSNGTTLFDQALSGNGILSTNIDVKLNESIFGEYTIVVGNETAVFYRTWSVTNITSGDFSLDAWLNFGNDLSFNSMWWSLFRYIVILASLLTVAGGFYYLDPFDSSTSALVASIIVVWLFGSFGWLTINTPAVDAIDKAIIPGLFSTVVIGFMIWRYKTQ